MSSFVTPSPHGYTAHMSRVEFDMTQTLDNAVGRTQLQRGAWVRFVERCRYTDGSGRGDVFYSPLFKVVKRYDNNFWPGECLLLNLDGKLEIYNPNQWSGAFRGDQVQVFGSTFAWKFLGESLYLKLEGIFEKEKERLAKEKA